jgi:hypothetical protein
VGLRFRKSIKLGKGVRLNVSKSGLGMSVGGRGARFGVHSSGRNTRTIGPGTGGSPRQPARHVVPLAPATAAWLLPRPGLFSGKAAKRYHAGVHAYLRGDDQTAITALEECLAAHPAALSAHLMAAMCAGRLGRDDAEQILHLEALVASDGEMPDRYQLKYLPPHIAQRSLHCRITEHITAEIPFDSVGATLMLAEHSQRRPTTFGMFALHRTSRPKSAMSNFSISRLPNPPVWIAKRTGLLAPRACTRFPATEPGDYTMFCSLAGHESLGLRGTLSVSGS